MAFLAHRQSSCARSRRRSPRTRPEALLVVALAIVAAGTVVHAQSLAPDSPSAEYVRLGDRVIAVIAGAWQRIGGDALRDSWVPGKYETSLLEVLDDKVYAGLGNSPTGMGEAEAWEYDPSTDLWIQIGGGGVNGSWTNRRQVWALAALGGKLQVGMGTNSSPIVGEDEVWEWDPTGGSWAQIGGDGILASWNAGIDTVLAMLAANGKLYAGLGGGQGDGEVWEYDPGTPVWTRIGGDSVNGLTGDSVRTLANVGGTLYASMRIASQNESDVYEYSGGTWSKIGGDGLNGLGDFTVLDSSATVAGKVYMGTPSAAEAGVWEWNPGTSVWTRVGGGGANVSWAGDRGIGSLAARGATLLAGVGGGDEEVWEYDPATMAWTRLGSIDDWGEGYDTVSGLAVTPDDTVYVSFGLLAGDADVWRR